MTISGTDQTSLDVGAAVELPFTIIGGRRCGYVTFVSGPFHHGARGAARSLAAVSDVPLLVMCTPSADRAALRASGLQCIDVPEVFNPNDLDTRSGRFAATYGKLNAFRMTHLDRAVYLDSDMIVLRSIDELFEMSGFLAVADHGLAPRATTGSTPGCSCSSRRPHCSRACSTGFATPRRTTAVTRGS